MCGTYYHAVYSLAPPIGEKQLVALGGKQQALRETELMELKHLKAPASARSSYEKYLADMATAYRLEGVIIANIKTGPPPSPEIRDRVEHLQSGLYTQAAALGLGECAKNPYAATHTYKS